MKSGMRRASSSVIADVRGRRDPGDFARNRRRRPARIELPSRRDEHGTSDLDDPVELSRRQVSPASFRPSRLTHRAGRSRSSRPKLFGVGEEPFGFPRPLSWITFLLSLRLCRARIASEPEESRPSFPARPAVAHVTVPSGAAALVQERRSGDRHLAGRLPDARSNISRGRCPPRRAGRPKPTIRRSAPIRRCRRSTWAPERALGSIGDEPVSVPATSPPLMF